MLVYVAVVSLGMIIRASALHVARRTTQVKVEMLSSLAVRSGAFSTIVRIQAPRTLAAGVQSRQQSSTTKQIENWDKANQIFYGPERDKTNFPHPVQQEFSSKVRLGFIPEGFFQFFYPKTGVTGPYLFGTGLLAYLLSKEVWVVDHNFAEVLGFWAAFYILNRKLGSKLGKYIDERNAVAAEERFVKPITEAKKVYEDVITASEKTIWQEEGQKYIFQAKRENVDLQLESIYRQRLKTVYDEVKKRLDYQLELQSTKRRFEQEHMVRWIVDSVTKSITPQQEKESISKCIADLRGLAKA
ncbi:ATP synthase subunit b, mitochondrial-like [Haliotis rufescens]|uniref:ATP synthase subunit b, mitochondrial-like n=1 Tax=Haliotis rufescens TaxID=6454 RepID=UPI001EAFA17A|nr:ATP synthase subunit b, mitochondrial-like [Haliotis rufescens]